VQINDDGSLDQNFGKNGIQLTALTESNFVLDELLVIGNRLYVTGTGQDQTQHTIGIVLAYQLGCPVSIACPSNKVVFTDPGKCNAIVNDIAPVVTTACSTAIVNYILTGATTGSGTGSVSGMVFNKGITLVNYSLANDPTKSCAFTITVEDHETPLIANARPAPIHYGQQIIR
jgi:hypothetical protein